jgi:hypothetical protein
MKRTVRLTETARRDLSRLEDFLVDKNPDAASRMAETLASAILTLADHAERGQVGRDELRRINVPFGNSGYVIWYRTFTINVIVVRIKHARER